MSTDVAEAVRAAGRRGRLMFGVIGGVVAIIAFLLFLLGGISRMVAFPMGVIAATLLVLAWSKWSGAMEDIESGDLIRVTGTLTLTDKTTNYEWSSRRSCKLIMGGTQLPISADVADAVRASPAVKARKKSNNLFTNTSGDEIAFMGTVDYAPRSSLLLSIRMANGRLVWQHSGLSSDAGTGTT